jgi:hypothetical protein
MLTSLVFCLDIPKYIDKHRTKIIWIDQEKKRKKNFSSEYKPAENYFFTLNVRIILLRWDVWFNKITITFSLII